jgi:hypothetical protein
MTRLSVLLSWLAVAAAFVAACDTDPTAPNGACATTGDCPLGQLCDTTQGACIPEPQDGFAGAFSCTLYDDANHPMDPNGPPSTSDVVGTLGPTRYTFYLDAGCMVYTKQNPPFLALGFDVIPLGDQSDTLNIALPWPTPNVASIAVAMSDEDIGTGFVTGDRTDDPTYGPRLGYLTGGRVVFNGPLVPGSKLTGFVDISAAATPAQQEPLLSDCSNVGVAACGPSQGAECSPFGSNGGQSVCTFSCETQADCAPYGGFCDTAIGACTKECGGAADCPSFLSCRAATGSTQDVCD